MKIAVATFIGLLAMVAAACVESPEGAGQQPPPQVVTRTVTQTVLGPTQTITQPVTVTVPGPATQTTITQPVTVTVPGPIQIVTRTVTNTVTLTQTVPGTAQVVTQPVTVTVPGPAAPPAPAVRRATGVGGTIPFARGEPVVGFLILTADGNRYDGCYLANPAFAGIVTDGVVNPASNEVATARSCTTTVAPPSQPAPAPSAPPVQPSAPAQPAPVASQLPPFGQPPQPQIGHPSLYVETGVGQTRTWNQPVEADKTVIIGGFRVDGVSNGVYKALPGGQTVNTTVTDGFIAIVRSDWAQAEFCFRVGQARQFGWAAGTIQPLPGWTSC